MWVDRMGGRNKNKGCKTKNGKWLLTAPSDKMAKGCNNLIIYLETLSINPNLKGKTFISGIVAPGSNLWPDEAHTDGYSTTEKKLYELIDKEIHRLLKGWVMALLQLPEIRRNAKILLGGFHISLIYSGVLLNCRFHVLVNINTVYITNDKDALLVGKHEFTTGLWGNHLENI